ncbi:hypothetical protein ACCO45_012022, partial [Purpureocillium lilacinum]
PFNTSCLRPSRPTLHLSPHTFSCTFHPPHTGILHPSASSLPHATSLHPHARNGIFAFSSARTQRSFCEHHFPTLPTTVALLPAAAIAASKAPSDAASSEASSSSPLGCGCSARALFLLAPRFCQANKPLPTSGVVHARAPKWNGDLPSKKAKQKPTLPKHAQSLRTPQDPVPDSHPAFLHRLAQRRVPAPRHLSVLPVAFSHALPRSTDDDGSHRFHGLSFIRKRRRPESSGSGSPSSSGSDDSLIFPAAGPAPSSATENPTRAQAHDYEAAGALDHHYSAGGLDSATTTTTTATTSDADAASESTGKMPFRQRMARHFGESLSPEKQYLSYYDVCLTVEDVKMLKNDWLTDNNIAFWEEYLERETLSRYPQAHIVLLRPSMSFLLMKEHDTKSVKAALPDFNKVTHVFMPINDNTNPSLPEGGSHWSLLLISVLDGLAFHYDSDGWCERAGGSSRHSQVWRDHEPSLPLHQPRRHPQQENGSDCGVFVCLLMRHLLVKRLLSANAREKVSMSMSGKMVDSSGGRKEMLRIIENLRKEGERRRS